jgi:acyl-coenzyme A synthetase/AMP-(fatty) acid ligase
VRRNRLWKSSIGVLFDRKAELGSTTTFRLSRPLDVDLATRTVIDVKEMAESVREISGWLHAARVRSGDRIAVYKDNHFDCVLIAAAAVRIGAIPVMLSGLLPDDAVRALLARVEPKLLVTNRRLLTGAAAEGNPVTALAERTLCLDGSAPSAIDVADVRGTAEPAIALRANDELMMLTHTSGTTGIPKLIMYSADKIQSQMARLECVRWPLLAFHRDDTVAVFMPFTHARSFTWTYSMMSVPPAKVLVMTDNDPSVVRPLFREHSPTFVEGLPIDFFRLEELAGEGKKNVFSSVRMFASTFDAVHSSTIRTFLNASHRRFPVWRYAWGQSETGGLGVTLIGRREASKRKDLNSGPRSVGWPMPTFAQIKVVDPQSFSPVPAGRPGLVLARTKALCLGYYGEPERWNEKTIGEWWNTGDIGIKSRNGSLKLLDREVNSIPGMSCIELEDVLVDRLPRTCEVVVLGVTDRPPLPFVGTADGRLDESEWREAVRGLPELSDPVLIDLKDMPRTGTGKIRREELRNRYLSDSDRPGTGRWT